MARLVAPGLVQHGGLIWSQAKARKPGQCCVTRQDFAAGDLVYRPITNGGRRMDRVVASVWADLTQDQPHD